MPKPDEEADNLRKELTSLADQCRAEQKKACDSHDLGSGSSLPKAKAVVRKVLKGHINKVKAESHQQGTYVKAESHHDVRLLLSCLVDDWVAEN